jgi:REP element-mobilizing transposase RayT
MEKIEDSHYYHIYNRGNNRSDIFFEQDNYLYFLKLLKNHIEPNCSVFCYCLLPNHFHLLLRINDELENPSQQFSNLINAYTKAINLKYNRTGSVFQKPFKRIKILNEDYLKALVLYIHLNPEHHDICDDFSNYPYSSYKSIKSKLPTKLKRDEVISWFDNLENFEYVHKHKKLFINTEMEYLIIE